jgi:hypothetical protein
VTRLQVIWRSQALQALCVYCSVRVAQCNHVTGCPQYCLMQTSVQHALGSLGALKAAMYACVLLTVT